MTGPGSGLVPAALLDGQLVIAVSLKMYLDHARTLSWSAEVADLARSHPATVEGRVRLIILPSFPSLSAVVQAFAGTPVEVGAQDLFWEDRGPYTGAVSGTDLKQIGCNYVEVGHVERRRIFGEDEQTAGRKLTAALRNGLTPVLCVGEEQAASAEEAAAECITQLEAVLRFMEHEPAGAQLLIAYEPVWAIGMLEPADTDHIVTVAAALRAWIDATPSIGASSLIYGGSAGEGLLPRLRGVTDGLFLGRFAHDPGALKLILEESL